MSQRIIAIRRRHKDTFQASFLESRPKQTVLKCTNFPFLLYIVESLPDTVVSTILTKFLTITEFGVLETAICNRECRECLGKLVKSQYFVFETPIVFKSISRKEVYEGIDRMNHPLLFVHWLMKKNIQVNHICAEGNFVDNLDSIVMLSKCKSLNLKFLSLHGSSIDERLSWHIFKSLQYLSLSSCQYYMILQVVESMKVSPIPLLHLDLSGLINKRNGNVDDLVVKIATKCPDLQRVFLDKTGVSCNGVDFLLRNSQELKELSVRRCAPNVLSSVCFKFACGINDFSRTTDGLSFWGIAALEKLHIDDTYCYPLLMLELSACELKSLMISIEQAWLFVLYLIWRILSLFNNFQRTTFDDWRQSRSFPSDNDRTSIAEFFKSHLGVIDEYRIKESSFSVSKTFETGDFQRFSVPKDWYLSGFLQYLNHFQRFFKRIAENVTRMDIIAFNKTLTFDFPITSFWMPSNSTIMMLMMKDEDQNFNSSPDYFL